MPVAVLVQLRHFYRDHHHHHHHHHHHSLYLRNDQKIWITTKIHIFTKGFKHIECGRFLRDHAGFHEHNEPIVVLYKLWHDIINSHKVTKHACTFSCLPLATQYQSRRKTFMVHQTFVGWALYILYEFVKFPIRHLGLAIRNV